MSLSHTHVHTHTQTLLTHTNHAHTTQRGLGLQCYFSKKDIVCTGTPKHTPCAQNTQCATLQRIHWRCTHIHTHTHTHACTHAHVHPTYAHKLLSSWWCMNSTKMCHTRPQQCTQKVQVYCLKFNEDLPYAHKPLCSLCCHELKEDASHTTTIMYKKDSLYGIGFNEDMLHTHIIMTHPSCQVHRVAINSVEIHHTTQPQ